MGRSSPIERIFNKESKEKRYSAEKAESEETDSEISSRRRKFN